MKRTSLKKKLTVGTILTILLTVTACTNAKTSPETKAKGNEASPVQTENVQLQAQLEKELSDLKEERDLLQTQLEECESKLSQAQSDLAEALARQEELTNGYKLYKNVIS